MRYDSKNSRKYKRQDAEKGQQEIQRALANSRTCVAEQAEQKCGSALGSLGFSHTHGSPNPEQQRREGETK